MWCTATGQRRATLLRGLANGRDSLAWSPDSTLLACSTEGGCIRVWDAAQWDCVGALQVQGSSHPVLCLAWSPDAHFLASGHRSGGVRVWDMLSLQCIATLGDGKSVFSVAWSPDGSGLATAGGAGGGGVQLWVRADGSSLPWTGRPDTGPSDDAVVAWSRGRGAVATGTGSGSINLWEASALGCVHRGSLHGSGRVGRAALAWSPIPASPLLAAGSGGTDGGVLVWNVAARCPIATYDTRPRGKSEGRVFSLSWSPDGSTLAIGAESGVHLWRA